MRDTGIIVNINELEQTTITIELCCENGIERKDMRSIVIDDKNIALKKHIPSCFICEEEHSLIEFEKKKICKNCIHGISVLDIEL